MEALKTTDLEKIRKSMPKLSEVYEEISTTGEFKKYPILQRHYTGSVPDSGISM